MISTEKKKCIKIILSAEEDQRLSALAQNCGFSKAAYVKEMALSGNIVNSLPEATIRSILAVMYNLADQVEDVSASEQLREGAKRIWRSLK